DCCLPAINRTEDDWEDERVNVALAEECGSTVEKGGLAGAEFSADVTFCQWFCSLINVCSSLQSLLCLFERNIAWQNLGDLYAQNDVSVSKVQFHFKVFIPRIQIGRAH